MLGVLTLKSCYHSIHSIEYGDMQLISEVYDLLKVGMCDGLVMRFFRLWLLLHLLTTHAVQNHRMWRA
jgi:hypothetical protein